MAASVSTKNPPGLIFLQWRGTEQYHLGELRSDIFRSACQMILLDASFRSFMDEEFTMGKTEPKDRECCPVCSSKAAQFSKKHFNGAKLFFRRVKKQAKLGNSEYF